MFVCQVHFVSYYQCSPPGGSFLRMFPHRRIDNIVRKIYMPEWLRVIAG